MQLDEHVLDVPLETHVIARVDLRITEDAELREQLARGLRHELLESFGGAPEVRQSALVGFLDPLLRVVVPLEANRRRLLEDATNDLEHGVIDFLRLLEFGLELGGDVADGFGDSGVEEHDRERDRL